MAGKKVLPAFIRHRKDRCLASVISITDPLNFAPTQWFKPWPPPQRALVQVHTHTQTPAQTPLYLLAVWIKKLSRTLKLNVSLEPSRPKLRIQRKINWGMFWINSQFVEINLLFWSPNLFDSDFQGPLSPQLPWMRISYFCKLYQKCSNRCASFHSEWWITLASWWWYGTRAQLHSSNISGSQ